MRLFIAVLTGFTFPNRIFGRPTPNTTGGGSIWVFVEKKIVTFFKPTVGCCYLLLRRQGRYLRADAGHFKDFITGNGITDALLDAKRLHAAILQDTTEAYADYWLDRDLETIPLHFDAQRWGELDLNNKFMQAFFSVMQHDKNLSQRIPQIFNREISPLDAFTPPELLGVVLRELVRGNFNVLPSFMTTGLKMAGYKRAIAKRAKKTPVVSA